MTAAAKKTSKKQFKFNNQTNNFERASRFFVHFFAVTARVRRENASFHALQRKYTCDDEMVLGNSTLGGFTYVWQS